LCLLTAPPQALLVETSRQALAATAKRLVDRLRRGCKPALEHGEREADDVAPPPLPFCLQAVGAVHLLANVLRDGVVETSFELRQRVLHRVGAPLWEEGLAFEGQQLLLDHAPH